MAKEKEYIIDATGPDNLSKEGDDLKKSAKLTLSSYLSHLTKNADTGNSFPIEPSTPRVETSLRGNEGQPAVFKPGGEDANPGFTRTFPRGPNSAESAVSNFETLSNSGRISSLSDFLNKNNQVDGHNLYRDFRSSRQAGDPGVGDITGATTVQLPSGAPTLQRKISEMLVNGNRFNPKSETSPYIENGRFTSPGIPIEQGAFGTYDPDADRTTIEDLKKIAHSIMVRQTGHRVGEGDDPDGGSTAIPSGARIGQNTLSSEDIRASKAYSAPSRPSVQGAEIRYDDITGIALEPAKTYGTLFSYRNTFSDSTSNSAVSTRALGEYLLATTVFTSVLEIIKKAKTADRGENAEEKMRFFKSLENLGVPLTKNETWRCLIKGIMLFFSLPDSFSPVPSPIRGEGATAESAKVSTWFSGLVTRGELTDAILNGIFSSGYYANILRVVRRDLDQLLADLDFRDRNLSSPNRPSGLLGLIFRLNGYASWNFYVTLLKMGDLALKADSAEYSARNINSAPTGNSVNLHRSRRPELSKNGELTWSHRSAPALVLLNQKYVNASSVLGSTESLTNSLYQKIGSETKRPGTEHYGNLGRAGQARGIKDNLAFSGNRYSAEEVKEIEHELESEYCPFYFHDLRTNEVIGFHAFLTDLKDSYSVSYAETGGYGRVDKIKIYQDTTRSINVSWVLVATSDKDFDSMWWSVNKLISMIYPQFSMGKTVKAGDKSFVMPFSQIPTASPVIRLRVGDVIKSNYSKFNLARIFGLSEIKPKNVELEQTQSKSASSAFSISGYSPDEQLDRANRAIDREMSARFSNQSIDPAELTNFDIGFKPGDEKWGKAIIKSGVYIAQSTSFGKVVTTPANSSDSARNLYSTNPPPSGASNVFATIDSTIATDAEVRILERFVSNDEIKYLVQLSTPSEKIDSNTPKDAGHYLTYIVSPLDLIPIRPKPDLTPEQIESVEKFNNRVETEVNSFFDAKDNAIVRSFEAAGGRGLAGVITSFDMDWNEALWDMDQKYSRRAPTLIKCSIAFSPIHDIVPGLDNNGMMRAINYQVGSIAKPLSTLNAHHAESFVVPDASRSEE